MTKQGDEQPWEDLQKLVRESDSEGLALFLEELPAGETARVVSLLQEDERIRLLQILDPEVAAHLIELLPDVQAVGIIERLAPDAAAAIVDELPSDEQADIIGDLDDEDAGAILNAMDPGEARDARALSSYEDDVAGGLMVTEFLAYPADLDVNDVVADLRANSERYRGYDVQYAYVTSDAGALVGVLQLRDLLLASRSQAMRDLMRPSVMVVSDRSSLDELREFFEKYSYFGVPVVGDSGELVGVVRRTAVEEALADRSDMNYRKSQGIVGGEELRTMPVLLRSRRRLAWLSVNVVLNILAASVIAFFQDTISAVIALAVFLPIISDMSGCSGNQAVAVSMRELTLGIVRPQELMRVWLKEISVGLINGVALGLLIALAATLWQSSPVLGLVVGVALALNTVVAVSIGGTVPLFLKRLGLDPALASGPILTTITDMCGFFLVLQFASLALPWLSA